MRTDKVESQDYQGITNWNVLVIRMLLSFGGTEEVPAAVVAAAPLLNMKLVVAVVLAVEAAEAAKEQMAPQTGEHRYLMTCLV